MDCAEAEGMNLKKRICSFLIAVLTVGCFTACADRTEEPVSVSQKAEEDPSVSNKPGIEAAVTDGGDVIAWCLAYDVRELIGAEPFQADQIPDSMPVYNNKYKADGAGVPLQPAARDLVLRTGKDIAQAFDEKILDEGFYDTTDGHLNIRCEQSGIQIDPDETVFINFGEKYPLPTKFEDKNKNYLEALDYTIGVLEPLLTYWHIENPEKEIIHDYSFSGEKHFKCFLTNKDNCKGTLQVNILEGYLSSVRWKPNLLTDDEILGEYPTISLEEAKTLLLKGQYYSIVPLKDRIEESDISGVVIGYKEQCYDEVFLPFYAFYVDITNREEAATPEETLKLGLKDYATYLVPAIESEYLDEFPEIVVHFN
jgi:hypothetical protein